MRSKTLTSWLAVVVLVAIALAGWPAEAAAQSGCAGLWYYSSAGQACILAYRLETWANGVVAVFVFAGALVGLLIKPTVR